MQDFFEETVMEKTYNCTIVDRHNDGFLVKLEEMNTSQNLSDVVNRSLF